MMLWNFIVFAGFKKESACHEWMTSVWCDLISSTNLPLLRSLPRRPPAPTHWHRSALCQCVRSGYIGLYQGSVCANIDLRPIYVHGRCNYMYYTKGQCHTSQHFGVVPWCPISIPNHEYVKVKAIISSIFGIGMCWSISTVCHHRLIYKYFWTLNFPSIPVTIHQSHYAISTPQ